MRSDKKRNVKYVFIDIEDQEPSQKAEEEKKEESKENEPLRIDNSQSDVGLMIDRCDQSDPLSEPIDSSAGISQRIIVDQLD